MDQPQPGEYIAFISYRHMPLDKKAAKLIQKFIEKYTVPKNMQAAFGRKKLGKVFRDEDELPLSKNLSDSIITALDRSQFLIVVCSPDLPKSSWCDEEIQYFQKTHGNDRVIAVLIDGTPEESFSPRMLHVNSENGIKDVEPLAANIVGKNHTLNRKAFVKEMTRVIAALLGCPFDTLWQRERRRRWNTLAVAAAVSTALLLTIGVLIYKTTQSSNQLSVVQDQFDEKKAEQFQQAALEAADNNDEEAALRYYAEALANNPRNYPAQVGALVTLQSRGWYSLRENAAEKEETEPRDLLLSLPMSDNDRRLVNELFHDEDIDAIHKLAVSGDGTIAAFTAPLAGYVDTRKVMLVDNKTHTVLSVNEFPEDLGGVRCISIDYDGSHYAVETYIHKVHTRTNAPETRLYLFRADGARITVTERGKESQTCSLEYSKDGKLLLIGKEKIDSLLILSADTGEEEYPVLPLDIELANASFASDGSVIVSGKDGATKQYDLIRFAPVLAGEPSKSEPEEAQENDADDLPAVLYSYMTEKDPSLLPDWYTEEKKAGKILYNPTLLPGEMYLYSDQKSIILRDKNGTLLDSVPFDVLEHAIATFFVIEVDKTNSMFLIKASMSYGGQFTYFSVDYDAKKIVDFRTVVTGKDLSSFFDIVDGGYWVYAVDGDMLFYGIGEDVASRVVSLNGSRAEGSAFLDDSLFLQMFYSYIRNTSYTGRYLYDVRYGAALWDLAGERYLCRLEPSGAAYKLVDAAYQNGVLTYVRSMFPWQISDGEASTVQEGHSWSDYFYQETISVALQADVADGTLIAMLRGLSCYEPDDAGSLKWKEPVFTGELGSWGKTLLVKKAGDDPSVNT